MAQKFVDSFDLYNTADIPLRWTGGSTGAVIQSSIVRTGANALQMPNGSNYNAVSPSFAATARFIVGFAIYVASADFASSENGMFVTLYDSVGGDSRVKLILNLATSVIQVWANGSVIGTAGTLPQNGWHAIGLDVTFSETVGIILVYLDGAEVGNFTGVDTGSATADTIILGNSPGSGSFALICYYDDFFLYDGTGGVNDAYPGDLKILAFVPNGEGRVNNWTPNGATPNYLCVNDIPPDGDTTYVSSSTVDQEDTYTVPALPGGVSGIAGVQVAAFARKDDATDRAIALGVGNGTSEDFGGDLYLSESYGYVLEEFDTNPLTSAPWATSDWTDIQIALEVAV